jgi:undecaprenyl diphosphate synthase
LKKVELNIPKHVAIIMDGNGRWAKAKGMMRLKGHQAGAGTVKKIVEAAREMGISVLTLYAFSTENWKRPASEVSGLMSLLKSYLKSELKSMLGNDIQLRCIGQQENLPKEVLSVLRKSIEKTASNSGMILNLALSYGGRDEILRAARKMAQLCVEGKLQPEQITEDVLISQLYTAGLPDPDLLIRTGGESRLSNFLLWQASYSEIYFTDIKWPDFSKDDFSTAIQYFQKRQRRFGQTGEQVVVTN